MHLVGFIIRTYHDARSSECQNRKPKFVYCLMQHGRVQTIVNLSHNHNILEFNARIRASWLQRLKDTYKIKNWGHHQIKFWSSICHNASLKHMASDYVLDE